MIASTEARSRLISHGAALMLVAVFVVLQFMTLSYGTRINELPFIRDYYITSNVTQNSALEREAIAGPDSGRPETLDRAMLRFKLYSIEADEMLNVMALGAYYAALSKLGLLSTGSLKQMLANPQAINSVWIAGRAFIVLSIAAAGFLLYLSLAQFAPPQVSLAGLAIFLFCPATIMFS